MAGWLDLLFGSGPLKKAAGTATPPTPAAPTSAGISQADIAKMAQADADKKKKQQAQPVSSMMAPQPPKMGAK